MKKLIAAAYFIFVAAAANARNTAPENTPITNSPETTEKDLGMNTVAHNTESDAGKGAIVSAAAHARNSWLKTLKIKKDKNRITPDGINSLLANPLNQQDPPQKGENTAQNANPPEIKSVPKARRVERPTKVEGSAKRPDVGSAARPSGGSAKRSTMAGNPNALGNPARASRPAGAGRPVGAGRPGNGRGKN